MTTLATTRDVTDDTDLEGVALRFVPCSPEAWQWAFPYRLQRQEWQNVGLDNAFEAARWASRFTAHDTREMLTAGMTFTEGCRWDDQPIRLSNVAELGWGPLDPGTVHQPWIDAGFSSISVVILIGVGVTTADAASDLATVPLPAPWNEPDRVWAQRYAQATHPYTAAGWDPSRLAEHVRSTGAFPSSP